MSSSDPTSPSDLPTLTAEIVSAYVSQNSVSVRDLAGMIASVHSALVGLDARPELEPEKPVPPVPIKNTIGPDYIISLEDGRRYKSLKRHLGRRGLTPQQYRVKWSLPSDYPMVSASYAAQRSALAKQFGLGRKASGASSSRETSSGQSEEAEAAEQPTATKPKARSRAQPQSEPSTVESDGPDAQTTRKPERSAEIDATTKAKSKRGSGRKEPV